MCRDAATDGCPQIPPEVQKRTGWAEMAATLRHWPVFGFASCCTAIGVCTGLLWSFHIWSVSQTWLPYLGRCLSVEVRGSLANNGEVFIYLTVLSPLTEYQKKKMCFIFHYLVIFMCYY